MASATTVVGLIAGSVAVATFALNSSFTRNASVADGASTLVAAPVARLINIVGEDFRFEAPDAIPAGLTEFRLLNKGPSLHHMSILKLTDGKTIDDLRAALAKPGPLPSWANEMGGPNAADPGRESNAIMLLEPGNYALICFVDLDGPPHFTKGMVQALRVDPATEPVAKAVSSDAAIDLFDYNFKLSAPISPGKRTIKVTNNGPQAHEVELIRLATGVGIADFMKWMQKMDGPPPAAALGGISGMRPGLTQYFTADFEPGHYALICFVPDAKDGKPHVAHGMIQEITVQ